MRAKRMIINILATMGELIITVFTGFIVPNHIIRAYGSDVNGLVTSITQLLGYIALIESGIGAIGRANLYKPLAEKNVRELSIVVKTIENFYHKIAITFIAYVVVLAILVPQLVSNDFGNTYVVSLVVILSFSTLIQYFFGITCQTVVEADQKKYIPSIMQSLSLVLNMLVTVALIKLNASIHVVKLASVLTYAIRPVFLFAYVRKVYGYNKYVSPNDNILKQRWDGFAQHIAFFVHKNTDVVILTLFSTLDNVSVYSVYLLIVSGCAKLINVISGNLEPIFGNMIAKSEDEKLKSRFDLSSILIMQLSVVIFSTAAAVMIPFIKLYTAGITDANYLLPGFGIIMLISEGIYCIRLPYQSMIYAHGHFKQTRNGAIIEAIINVFLSIILVWKCGLIGVAVGTLVAMTFRTIHYSWYYYVRIRKDRVGIFVEIKKMGTAIVEVLIMAFANRIVVLMPEPCSYYEWFIMSCAMLIVNSIIMCSILLIVYKKEIVKAMQVVRRVV